MTENPPLSEYSDICKFFDTERKYCKYPFGLEKYTNVMCNSKTCKYVHEIENTKVQIQNHPLYTAILEIEDKQKIYCAKYYGESDEKLDAKFGEGMWDPDKYRCAGCEFKREIAHPDGFYRSCELETAHSVVYSILNKSISKFKNTTLYSKTFFEKNRQI